MMVGDAPSANPFLPNLFPSVQGDARSALRPVVVGRQLQAAPQECKRTHGVLNAVSWGILMPMGAIIARYMRVFKSADPTWFYLHVRCQCSAYIVRVAEWGTDLKLGSDSKRITFHSHRNIGIALSSLATFRGF